MILFPHNDGPERSLTLNQGRLQEISLGVGGYVVVHGHCTSQCSKSPKQHLELSALIDVQGVGYNTPNRPLPTA